jgi:phage recombination protein Bet
MPEQQAPLTPEEIEARAKRVEAHRLDLVRLPVMTEMAKSYGFAEDILRFEDTLIKTVFPIPKDGQKPPSTAQLLMFLNVAREYKLNPFIREIYAFPKDGGIVPIVPIDGWITIVQRREGYNGHRFEYEWQDGKPGNAMLSAKCIMYRKDTEHPIEHTEYMVECVKDTTVWKKWPRRMLTHKAFIQCARYAFGLSGIYDEDEGERILQQDDGSEVIAPKQVALPQRKSQTLQAPQPQNYPDNAKAQQPVQVQQRAKQHPAEDGADYRTQPLKEHAVPAQPATATDVYDDYNEDAEPPEQAQDAPQQLQAGPGYVDYLAAVLNGMEEPPATPELPSKPELTAPLQELFEKGQVQRASDVKPPAEERKPGTIGKNKAVFLHRKLTSLKKRTEKELQDVLKGIGLEHLRDLPEDISDNVERWIEGKDLKQVLGG